MGQSSTKIVGILAIVIGLLVLAGLIYLGVTGSLF